MKLMLVLNKNSEETFNTVFSLAMTATATGDEVAIFIMGSGTAFFERAGKGEALCCGMKFSELIAGHKEIKVCLCVESSSCNISKSDVPEGVQEVDMLEMVQMIRDYDNVLVF